MSKYRDNVVCSDYSNQQQTIATQQTATSKNTKPQKVEVIKPPS